MNLVSGRQTENDMLIQSVRLHRSGLELGLMSDSDTESKSQMASFLSHMSF